jgi:hypothetical protein
MLSSPRLLTVACSVSMLRTLGCHVLVAAALLLMSLAPVQAQSVPRLPTIEGPITGPGPMHAGGVGGGPAGTRLIADFGYIVEEYFVSGFAGPTNAPYKVRMLIWRPPTPEQSTRIVVAEPTHRGGGALICQFARYGIGQRGHICLTVGAREINLVNAATPAAGLLAFNPQRYGTLVVANNQSNEILAQIGWLIKSNDPDSPLASYRVAHIVMGGTSDSSDATRSYMGSGAAGFRTSAGGPIYEGFFVGSTLGTAPVQMTDVPTIQMPTQFEVNSTNNYRRPDSDTPPNLFRIYEVAGMSHNDAREGTFVGCDHPNLSQFPYGALVFMGLQHMIDWAVDGTLPPHAPYMQVNPGPPRIIVADEFGNAQGGVRTTNLDVPVYSYTVPNSGPGLCNQTGYQTPLTEAAYHLLYPTAEDYANKVSTRLTELVAQGWFPPEYTDRYVLADVTDFIRTSGVWTPDLTVTAPAVSILQLPGYVQATFTAIVSNTGTRGVQDVAVRFLVDGAPIGADRTIDRLPSGQSTRVVYERWFARQDGPHVVGVTVDPADVAGESNRSNNSSSTPMVVVVAPPAGN